MNELKKIENFLGIRSIFKKEHFVYDEKKKFYCVNDNNNYQHLCLGSDKGLLHYDFDENILQKLKKFYEPFNRKFFEMIKQKPFWSI